MSRADDRSFASTNFRKIDLLHYETHSLSPLSIYTLKSPKVHRLLKEICLKSPKAQPSASQILPDTVSGEKGIQAVPTTPI